MANKEVLVFPYINISNIIKMDDFEIHPYKDYDLNIELTADEKVLLDDYVNSFRATFFKEWESPEIANWVWILKYRWTILRDKDNYDGIQEKVKILFLLLKLHISYDFFNPWMNHIHTKSFDIFWFNLSNNFTNKFWNMSECKSLHSTVPENINWLWGLKFYPIHFCANNIPVEFKIFWWWDEIFWIDPKITDLTYLHQWILKDAEYYQKFLNTASVHYWLEQQNDLFFYYSIIPSIIEVLLQLDTFDIKKQKALEFWKKLDEQIIQKNEKTKTLIYIKRNWYEVKEELWIIARTFVLIYDLRNELLHEWKKAFDKLKVNFHWIDLRIYDIFQLIFKYTILNDLVEKWIIANTFIKVKIDWNIFTTWNFTVTYTSNNPLSMDEELDGLLKKSESDRDIENSKE